MYECLCVCVRECGCVGVYLIKRHYIIIRSANDYLLKSEFGNSPSSECLLHNDGVTKCDGHRKEVGFIPPPPNFSGTAQSFGGKNGYARDLNTRFRNDFDK